MSILTKTIETLHWITLGLFLVAFAINLLIHSVDGVAEAGQHLAAKVPTWYIESLEAQSNPANHHIGMEEYVDEQIANQKEVNKTIEHTGKILRPRTFPCHEQQGTAPCYDSYYYSK